MSKLQRQEQLLLPHRVNRKQLEICFADCLAGFAQFAKATERGHNSPQHRHGRAAIGHCQDFVAAELNIASCRKHFLQPERIGRTLVNRGAKGNPRASAVNHNPVQKNVPYR